MIKRNRSTLYGVMAVALLFGGAMSAYAHDPLTSWGGCPSSATSTSSRFAPLPTFAQGTVGSDVTAWPAVGSYDFCGYMDTLYCQLKPVAGVVDDPNDPSNQPVTTYADLLRCLDADINGQVYNEPAASVPVSISVNSSGQCTVYWNNILIHNNVTIPGWSAQAAWRMGFGARTGGSDDYHIVDDFNLVSPVQNYYESFLGGAGSGTLYGSAAVSSNQLILTVDDPSLTGSWTFTPSGALSEFTVTYLQYIGDGSGADGLCFFYGAGADGPFGESGPGTPVPQEGLRVTFHTWDPDNTIRLVYNGTILADSNSAGELRQLDEWLPVSGNGMIDGQYEFALLQYVLNTPEHPLHADAHAALQNNFIYFKNLVQQALLDQGYLGLAPIIAPYLVGSLSMTLAGYATLGDPSTYDALNTVLGLLSELGIEPPVGGIAGVAESVPTIGCVYDFEGDGFSNIDEYFYVEEYRGLTVTNYLDYAMNAPTGSVAGAKYYQVGTKITLSPRLTYGGLIEGVSWSKDSTPIGTDNPLVINNCVYADAGVYEATITHRMGPAKGTGQTIGTGTVTVGDDPIPVAGLAGLAALSGAIALLAARRMRHRK